LEDIMTESILKTTIPKGQTMSNALDLRIGQLVRIHFPSDWTQAPMTVVLSPDNNLWSSLVDRNGVDYTFAVVPNGVFMPQAGLTRSLGWVRLRSGIREKQTPQAADREFTLVMWS
jgi:hypothetical protein